MIKRSLSFIMIIVLSIMLIIPNQIARAATFSKRLAGNDRYETSSMIANEGWTNSQYAVIVSGQGFPDALSAAPLAKKYEAPILLNGKDALDPNTKSTLQNIGVKSLFIVGGEGVISSSVGIQLNNIGIDVIRIAGKDRFETSFKVAQNIGTSNGVVLVNGYAFADALSIAPVAAAKGWPILLSASETLNPEIASAFISSHGIPYIIGGNGSISDSIASQLGNPTRISGKNRYETNAAVLRKFADDFSYDKVYVASGQNYPDALSGAVLAAKYNSPLILAANILDISVLDAIKLKHDLYKDVIAFGGSAVLSDSVVSSIINGAATVSPSQGERQIFGTAKDLSAGTFTGGKDIQAGLYDVTPVEGNGNFIVEGNDWKLYTNEILGMEYGLGVEKVRANIQNGDNIRLEGISKAHFEPVTTPFVTKVNQLFLYSGTWKVGEDIAAGRYRASVSNGTGNFIIYGTDDLLKINEILNANSDVDMGVKETTVNLDKGDIIKISSLNQVEFTPSN